MEIELTPIEARLLGCLLEKEITTPEQYPLSLNTLLNACNQKSNRVPVMNLTESEALAILDGLLTRRLVAEMGGSRVSRYKHRFCNTEFGTLKFTPQQLGIVIVLLLRGPQTPGELRSRTNRLCEFSDVQEVEQVIQSLLTRDEPLLVKLPREPGRRDARYAHLFSGEVEIEAQGVDLQARVRELEAEVVALKQERDQLQQQLAVCLDK